MVGCCGRTFCFFKVLLHVLVGCVLPIAMIVIGSIHLNDCPREFHIPIFLIVFGGALILMSLCALAMIVFNRKRITVLVFFILHLFFLLFNLGWLIAGSVWVFRIRSDYHNSLPSDPRYCEPTLYIFSFSMCIIYYFHLVLVAILSVLHYRDDDSNDDSFFVS